MNSTEICNMALSAIAKGRIVSISEDSEAARQCKIYYDQLRKNLLSLFRWGFADKSAKLALVNTDIPKWTYAYAYPNDCLAIRQLYNREGGILYDASRKDTDYNEYDTSAISDSVKIIMCDIPNAYLDYTADVKNAEQFSSWFCEALVHYLAAHLAMPLTASESTAQAEMQLYQISIQQAMAASAIEVHHKPEYPTAYADARR